MNLVNINQKNKKTQGIRVAKNAAHLFTRMLVLMLINLYIVRVLLHALGLVDYGVFQAVAGVVTTLTCLSSVLSISTQRFYCYAQGRGELGALCHIYSASLNINVILSGFIFLLFETVGLWYLNTQMLIPETRMFAAHQLFHFSILSFVCTVLQIPFMAAMMAHEDMGWYTLISTMEWVARLVIALTIGLFPVDGLVYYGGGLCVVSCLVLLGYILIGRYRYSELRYVKVKDVGLYRKLLSFSGWTMFGALANVGMFQGTNLLLNAFFGAVMNAAYGVAFQINSAINNLCNNVVLALRPLMMQTVARKDDVYTKKLFMMSSKFVFYISMIAAVPLYYGMPYLLELWLEEEVIGEMVLFSRLIVLYVLVSVLHHPITIVIQAEGKVKMYHLIVESITLFCLPLSYVMFKCEAPAYAAYLSMIIVMALAHVARLFVLKHYCPWFTFSAYILNMLTGIGFKSEERKFIGQIIGMLRKKHE